MMMMMTLMRNGVVVVCWRARMMVVERFDGDDCLQQYHRAGLGHLHWMIPE